MDRHVEQRTPTAFLSKRANARTLVALAVIGLSFNLFIFPWRTARVREFSGIADRLLDIRFSYSPDEVFDLAARLGERGRQLYALSELSIDAIYPLLYSSFFYLLLLLVIPRAFSNHPRWQRLALLPFAALACDYAENVSLAIILLGFPETMPVAPFANLFTMAKWMFGAISIVLLLTGSLKLLVRKWTTARGLIQ
jgi:hypothetical protein